MKAGFITDPIFLKHRSAAPHPERPERFEAVLLALDGLDILRLEAADADESYLAAVHTRSHIESVREISRRGSAMIDADTYVNRDSFAAAQRAAGAVIAGVDAVMSGTCSTVFCGVRPPGHHAESDRAMGFCLFNNIAVGARYAQTRHHLEKICIIDWDVHHGNGTQEIFYEDPSVLYISTHQFPLYPGTGRREETGRGAGTGFTVNVPMTAGGGDEAFVQVFENELAKVVSDFRPDLIMISAGFDAHTDDPLAGMNMTDAGFGKLTHIAAGWAQEHCKGRLVSVLEGGYDLPALSASVKAHVGALQYE